MTEFMTEFLTGIRGMLFASAAVSAVMFSLQSPEAWTLICAMYWRRVRKSQILALASFGWFVMALSSMLLTAHWLIPVLEGKRPVSLMVPADSIWSLTGLWGLAWGFVIPVTAMLWFRGYLLLAIALAMFEMLVGAGFAWEARHLILTR